MIAVFEKDEASVKLMVRAMGEKRTVSPPLPDSDRPMLLVVPLCVLVEAPKCNVSIGCSPCLKSVKLELATQQQTETRTR